jgi:hypothetical protein
MARSVTPLHGVFVQPMESEGHPALLMRLFALDPLPHR